MSDVILVINPAPRNEISTLETANYQVCHIAEYSALAVKQHNPRLVLFDDETLLNTPQQLESLRQSFPEVAVCCLTDANNVEQVLALAVDDLVLKPVQSAVLLHRVQMMEQIQQHRRQEVQRHFAETLQATAAALVSTLELRDLLKVILSQAHQVIPIYDSANVMLFKEDSIHLSIAWHITYSALDDEPQTIVGDFHQPLQSLHNLNHMYHSRQPMWIDDVREYPNWRVLGERDWIRSYMGAPIIVDDEVIGFINLNSNQVGAFRASDAERLQAFTYYVGIAIQNAHLFDAVQRATEVLEARVIERTRELEAEKAQLATILNEINEGVVFYGEEAAPQYVNHALVQMFGYSKQDWLGGLSLTPEAFKRQCPPALYHTICDALAKHNHWAYEGKMRRADEQVIDVQITARAVSIDAQQVGAIVIYRDITQEKMLQERQTRFVAYASHQLRTPITNLSTRLYLMKRQPEKLNTHLGVLENVIDQMKQLVENLLQISRINNPTLDLEPHIISVDDIMDDVYRIQREEGKQQHVMLNYQPADAQFIVNGDTLYLIQILTNLTSNAIRHTSSGGQVTLYSTMTDMPDPDAYYSHPLSDSVARWVGLSVEDTGYGIAPEHIPYVFQPFYRAENKTYGTGLGLTIAADLAHLHNGTIRDRKSVV
jgi:PAS domain S-box-containing protein